MALNTFMKNLILKNEKIVFDTYYLKNSYNLYRFKSRLINDKINYPPDIFGEEDRLKIGKSMTNPIMKSTLKIKEHPENPHFPDEYSLDGPPYGHIYDTVPFKFTVEKGKTYNWCACGYSNNQPFCDHTHRIYWTNNLVKRVPKYRPIKYTADETKEVWFCNCKQSKERPICDGTCKTPVVKKTV